eukprot:165394-Prymnesium_polylepis.1
MSSIAEQFGQRCHCLRRLLPGGSGNSFRILPVSCAAPCGTGSTASHSSTPASSAASAWTCRPR